MMNWWRVLKSVQALAAHSLLFSFTLLLVLKLDGVAASYSWWIIFFPLWIFHAVVARGRFSLPAPSVPHSRLWAPCHTIAATPLLVAFELLLCIYLESVSDMAVLSRITYWIREWIQYASDMVGYALDTYLDRRIQHLTDEYGYPTVWIWLSLPWPLTQSGGRRPHEEDDAIWWKETLRRR